MRPDVNSTRLWFDWDARDQLSNLTGPINASFSYDGFGRRASTTIAGITTGCLYDGANLVQELIGGAPTANMLTGLGIDEVFSRTDSTGTRTFLTDALGSTLALTDESGTEQTTTTYTWDPTGLGTVENVFGPAGLAQQVNDSSQTSQFASADALGTICLITDGAGNVVGSGSYRPLGVPDSGSGTLGGFGFTGEQVDPESGFVYLRNRFYDPTTSRFLTPDRLGAVGSGVNLYAYVGNSPATLTDPSGWNGEDPNGAYNEATLSWLLEGITYGNAPPELIPWDWQEGYRIEAEAEAEAAVEPIYGPPMPAELPAGAGAFGPAGEGGMYCPETEGPPATANNAGTTDPAARRVTLRQGTKQAIQDAAFKNSNGDYLDSNTGKVIPKNGPFDYGHKTDYEWWRTQQRARAEGWSRQDVIEYVNDPIHYQIEDPRANRSHEFESPR